MFTNEYLKVTGRAISDSWGTSEYAILLGTANSAQRITSNYLGEPSVTKVLARCTLYFLVTSNKY